MDLPGVFVEAIFRCGCVDSVVMHMSKFVIHFSIRQFVLPRRVKLHDGYRRLAAVILRRQAKIAPRPATSSCHALTRAYSTPPRHRLPLPPLPAVPALLTLSSRTRSKTRNKTPVSARSETRLYHAIASTSLS